MGDRQSMIQEGSEGSGKKPLVQIQRSTVVDKWEKECKRWGTRPLQWEKVGDKTTSYARTEHPITRSLFGEEFAVESM